MNDKVTKITIKLSLSRYRYITHFIDRGLCLIEGRTVNDLTTLLKGMPNTHIQAVNNYKLRLNHLSLVQIIDNLSIIDAKDYIIDAKIGFR
jgi:hypothetical protein